MLEEIIEMSAFERTVFASYIFQTFEKILNSEQLC